MSAIPTLAPYSGRGQPIGPMDFNSYLEQRAAFFDEEGNDQQMSLHAVVTRGENIAKALEGRVKRFNELKHTEPKTFESSTAEGKALLDQFDTLCLLVETVKEVVKDFKGFHERYSLDADQEITGSYPVMCYEDACELTHKFELFIKTMVDNYLTEGRLKTYLADRVSVLKSNLAEIKV